MDHLPAGLRRSSALYVHFFSARSSDWLNRPLTAYRRTGPSAGALYTVLTQIDSSPVVFLNRAIALSHVSGPAAALAEVEKLAEPLQPYHLFHATPAALLRDLHRFDEATMADAVALTLTKNVGERALLEERLTALSHR